MTFYFVSYNSPGNLSDFEYFGLNVQVKFDSKHDDHSDEAWDNIYEIKKRTGESVFRRHLLLKYDSGRYMLVKLTDDLSLIRKTKIFPVEIRNEKFSDYEYWDNFYKRTFKIEEYFSLIFFILVFASLVCVKEKILFSITFLLLYRFFKEPCQWFSFSIKSLFQPNMTETCMPHNKYLLLNGSLELFSFDRGSKPLEMKEDFLIDFEDSYHYVYSDLYNKGLLPSHYYKNGLKRMKTLSGNNLKFPDKPILGKLKIIRNLDIPYSPKLFKIFDFSKGLDWSSEHDYSQEYNFKVKGLEMHLKQGFLTIKDNKTIIFKRQFYRRNFYSLLKFIPFFENSEINPWEEVSPMNALNLISEGYSTSLNSSKDFKVVLSEKYIPTCLKIILYNKIRKVYNNIIKNNENYLFCGGKTPLFSKDHLELTVSDNPNFFEFRDKTVINNHLLTESEFKEITNDYSFRLTKTNNKILYGFIPSQNQLPMIKKCAENLKISIFQLLYMINTSDNKRALSIGSLFTMTLTKKQYQLCYIKNFLNMNHGPFRYIRRKFKTAEESANLDLLKYKEEMDSKKIISDDIIDFYMNCESEDEVVKKSREIFDFLIEEAIKEKELKGEKFSLKSTKIFKFTQVNPKLSFEALLRDKEIILRDRTKTYLRFFRRNKKFTNKQSSFNLPEKEDLFKIDYDKIFENLRLKKFDEGDLKSKIKEEELSSMDMILIEEESERLSIISDIKDRVKKKEFRQEERYDHKLLKSSYRLKEEVGTKSEIIEIVKLNSKKLMEEYQYFKSFEKFSAKKSRLFIYLNANPTDPEMDEERFKLLLRARANIALRESRKGVEFNKKTMEKLEPCESTIKETERDLSTEEVMNTQEYEKKVKESKEKFSKKIASSFFKARKSLYYRKDDSVDYYTDSKGSLIQGMLNPIQTPGYRLKEVKRKTKFKNRDTADKMLTFEMIFVLLSLIVKAEKPLKLTSVIINTKFNFSKEMEQEFKINKRTFKKMRYFKNIYVSTTKTKNSMLVKFNQITKMYSAT